MDVCNPIDKLTKAQARFLAVRYDCRTDKEAALRCGLCSATPYLWRWRSPAFRRAEQQFGRNLVELAQIRMLQRLDAAFAARLDERLQKRVGKRRRSQQS
jgi:hypothetical protein